MQFENVAICGLAHVDAHQRIPSSLFEERIAGTMKRLGLPTTMLRDVAGIEARRWWDEGFGPSQAASLAAEKVLEESGVPRERLGVVVNTSVCRDYIEPSTASLVHQSLGLGPNCLNFDLGNACLGFLNAMEVVGMMLEQGQIDYGLVVDGEQSRDVQEATLDRIANSEMDLNTFRAQFATLTLGSGAVAMILTRRELAPEGHRFVGGVNVAATEHAGLCRGQVNYMETDTRGLLNEGVKLAGRTFGLAQDKLGWQPGCLDHLVLHQVSAVHTRKLCLALGLDPEKALLTFPELGNVGPASVPITLSKLADSGAISAGQRVGLLGIGSGLNCAMAEIVW